ncbi:DUF3489 domain-containing protein [Yoonia sp.]|uniref:DUF3489 domain-containing protein n=1 Tax=Yoonia sp. TaxID=2212373 RepID=UPI00233935C0|nr:DUF3489 domain-containing protein [Yoonia sp.]MDB4254609.1 DUF3489 domain-containing protein [bacterium]
MPEKPGKTLARKNAQTARRPQTRHEQLRRLLSRKSGATITQIQKAFVWKPHTARAAISALRKAGSRVERIATEKGSVYRIADRGEDA